MSLDKTRLCDVTMCDGSRLAVDISYLVGVSYYSLLVTNLKKTPVATHSHVSSAA